jgi:hypothetical protein
MGHDNLAVSQRVDNMGTTIMLMTLDLDEAPRRRSPPKASARRHGPGEEGARAIRS